MFRSQPELATPSPACRVERVISKFNHPPAACLACPSTTQLAGSAKGGDCNHLLLASSPFKFIHVRAHGGEILIDSTHVESWDMSAGDVDENYADGRRCCCFLANGKLT